MSETIPKRIVVGLDGSPGSARALEWAIAMAQAIQSEIVAVHVFQLVPQVPAIYGLAPIPFSNGWQDELRTLFKQEWCAPLRKAGLRFRTVFQEGSPAPELIDVARREDAGLIVTGTRGFGGFKELMLGSVSHQLVMHADVPVVVIPPERTAKRHETAQEPAAAVIAAMGAR